MCGIEYFRSASGFTTGYKHFPVVKQRSGVTRARRTHGRTDHVKTSSWVCRIENFRGRQRAASARATGHKDAAIGQARRSVIHARSRKRCARGRGLRFWIKNFGNGDEVPGVVASASDHDTPIGQRGRGVTYAGNNKRIELLHLMRT